MGKAVGRLGGSLPRPVDLDDAREAGLGSKLVSRAGDLVHGHDTSQLGARTPLGCRSDAALRPDRGAAGFDYLEAPRVGTQVDKGSRL